MNTSTLRGIFPDPKPIHRRNFVKENIKHLKEMQGFIQQEKITTQSQEIKSDKFKHVVPKVYSNISSFRKSSSKDNLAKRPMTHNQLTKNVQKPVRCFPKTKSELKSVHRGVQTERPEDIPKLYETGILKYPSPSVISNKTTPHKPREKGDATYNITKNLKNLDLEEKHDYVKENIKNIKTKTKQDESPDPTLPPSTYQKGALPKYLKDRKENDIKSVEFVETDGIPGLVLLPDDERKEYLRVARENYAGLIKELNSMPVSNDTLKRRKRKMEIEDELKRLDEVIKIFQKPKVFVKADA